VQANGSVERASTSRLRRLDAAHVKRWASMNESVATFEAMGIDPERGEFAVIVS
jgi:hypothetical protein